MNKKEPIMVLPTRREFLEGGLAAAAAITVAPPALAAAGTSLPLYAVVHDLRFAAGRSFAAEAQRQGVPVKAIDGKVHALWHDDLYHHWNSQPLPLAGMTTHDALFLLAMMGRDAGMRVIYRAHHRLGPKGEALAHATFGPPDLLTRHPRFGGPDVRWGTAAARIVTAWPRTAAAMRSSASTIGHADRHAISRDGLVTWLMVPASIPA